MIFVGHGALLWRAVRHTRDLGYPVDLVCTEAGARPAEPGVDPDRITETTDVNRLAGELSAACTDGIVWSIDNRFLFREPVLDLGLRILNVHGGPLPGYRGLPLATAAYAILNGETEFAATLHEVAPALDSGPVLAEQRFPIAADDTLEDVLMELVEACHQVFVDNLDPVRGGTASARPQPAGPGGYYGLRALREMIDHRDHPNYERATDLGLFEDFYPDAAAAWR
jgi:methionyl-tRNA formyltransferase